MKAAAVIGRCARAIRPRLPGGRPLVLLGTQARSLASAPTGAGLSEVRKEVEEALPHLKPPTEAELDEEPQESNFKDGLAIKMATSTFAGRRRWVGHKID
jgi:hypothetical protein